MTNKAVGKKQLIGLISGFALFLIMLSLPYSHNMPDNSLQVAAVATLMAIFWITEAIPFAATALLPIVLFPVLGVMPSSRVTEFYGNHLIFLFMGGFLIAISIEKWNLHKRMALHTILLVGISSRQIILGFMLSTAFLSAWISNTATAMMMLTIGLAVVKQTQLKDSGTSSQFSTALMLGIAYSASIGGVATLIGTPPNAILAGIIESNFNYSISFAQWMVFGAPLSMLMLILCWIYLTRIAFKPEFSELPGGKENIKQQLLDLGPISKPEKRVLLIFILVAAGWLLRGLLDIKALDSVKDSSIAMAGAILLFIIPADYKKGEFLLDWPTAKKIPWDIMILFGGGFALAGGFASSGLTEWLANQLISLQGMNLIIIVGVVVLLVIFLTEVTSNTATSSLLLPVMGAFAIAIQVHPLYLMVAVAISASFAFMLPVATPPNAIVFSSRKITIPQMAKAGLWLNLLGSILITLFVIFYLPVVFDT